MSDGLRDIKRQKYARCKEIEQETGMKQNLDLDWREHSQQHMFFWGMCVFLVAWVIALVCVWFRFGRAV